MLKEFWDNRYGDSHYVYGKEPNQFFKETIDNFPVGKILLPAEGEGRNGVYAASKGWQVDAFDVSSEARNKALFLAQASEIDFSYQVLEFKDVLTNYEFNSFDVIALIYLHVPLQLKMQYFSNLITLLKPGGYLIFEGFSKDHTKNQEENPMAGGPQQVDLLYSKDEITSFFSELHFIQLSEEEIILSEGVGHNGKGSVIRFIGLKKEI